MVERCISLQNPSQISLKKVEPLGSIFAGLLDFETQSPSLKLTAKAPENEWLDMIMIVSFWDGLFSRVFAVSFREGTEFFAVCTRNSVQLVHCPLPADLKAKEGMVV